jgi:hypothetical protein
MEGRGLGGTVGSLIFGRPKAALPPTKNNPVGQCHPCKNKPILCILVYHIISYDSNCE